jgi:hypothetical protein
MLKDAEGHHGGKEAMQCVLHRWLNFSRLYVVSSEKQNTPMNKALLAGESFSAGTSLVTVASASVAAAAAATTITAI